MKRLLSTFGLALLVGASTAYAAPMVLTFEGLDDVEAVENFYNGGTSENGNTGPNFGVTFSDNTLALIDEDAGGSGNFGGEPSPSTVLFFLTGASSIMNVAAGFDTGFSFFYSAITDPGSVSVFSGLNGTGTLLTSLFIPTTPFAGQPDPTGEFSPFVPIGVTFDGVASSVSFAGVQNRIGFDNVTFGAATAGGGGPTSSVPAPGTLALLSLGLVGLLGAFMKRQKI